MAIVYLGWIVIILALAALVGFVVLVFGYDAFWLVRNWLTPTSRVEARVIRKTTKPWDVTIVGETPEMQLARLGMLGRDRKAAAKAYARLAAIQDVPEITLAEGTDWYVTFSISGREIELAVPMPDYVALEEGMEGLLVFKGERFVRFAPVDRETAGI